MNPKKLTPKEHAAYRELLEAMQRHGENSDDPEHEVGDLQDCLSLALELLGPAGRKKFFSDKFVKDTLTENP